MDDAIDVQGVRTEGQRSRAVDIANEHGIAVRVGQTHRVAAEHIDQSLHVVGRVGQRDHTTVGVDGSGGQNINFVALCDRPVRGKDESPVDVAGSAVKVNRIAVGQRDSRPGNDPDVVEVVVHSVEGHGVRSRRNGGLTCDLHTVNCLRDGTTCLYQQVLRRGDLAKDDGVSVAQSDVHSCPSSQVRS